MFLNCFSQLVHENGTDDAHFWPEQPKPPLASLSKIAAIN